MTPRRVLVTGGAGFIGSHLVDALVSRGDDVAVVDNLSVGVRDNVAQHDGRPGSSFHALTCSTRPPCGIWLPGVDTVFHLATQCVRLSLFEPELVHRVNAEGTLNMLLAAVSSRVSNGSSMCRLRKCSAPASASRWPRITRSIRRPFTAQASSRASCTPPRSTGRTGFRHVIVRPFNTYGPRAHFEGAYGELIPKFVVRVLNGRRPIMFGDGEQTRDFTHVSDTVNGMILAADSTQLTGSSVNIARGEEVTVNAIARARAEGLRSRGPAPGTWPRASG